MQGDELRIFDHELAFSHGLIIGWIPPWRMGGLKFMETKGNHIFLSRLRGRNIDFQPIRATWAGLSDAAIEGYKEALPAEWTGVAGAATSAIRLVREGASQSVVTFATIMFRSRGDSDLFSFIIPGPH